MENHGLVVRKLEDKDSQSLRDWADRAAMVKAKLAKLDGPALRGILGREYHDIFGALTYRPAGARPPVPMEELEEPDDDTRRCSAAESRTPTQPNTMASSARCPRGSSCRSDTDTQQLLKTSAHDSRAWSRPDHASPSARHAVNDPNNPKPPLTPAASSPSETSPGYQLFAAELGQRLRKLQSFTTPESVQASIRKRWQALSAQDRQYYDAKAARMRSSAVPFDPRQDRLPLSPKASPNPPLPLTQPAARSTPRDGGHAVPDSSRWRQPRPPASTPRPRPTPYAAAAAAKPPPSRALAPVSSSRLNSAASRGVQPRIKAEKPPHGTSSRGAKGKAVGVIDLTGGSQARIKAEKLPHGTSSRGGRRKAVEVVDLTGED
ncbi:2425d811-1555-494e-9832-4d54b4043094 [Thermothielavioides terrestris]|uniref:Uncharacterized protein n=2 Tax=Thermothielavioides terrestris TaxID=2587410 RepID=G2QZJ6_THETT|nr:uncharacterized protein THITE_2095021 [Thermothielavioides terrestris NRRL 8126]AEO65522.1 hypothetical protein THITE_2095021 [Thermothielavioides terrestris NRRL 8126]SPQ19225.1 2425d811-1555-494e-9832-4d54b4043094 [Thermothielavioides terrestris]